MVNVDRDLPPSSNPYAEISRNGRSVARLDSLHYSLETTDFALFPFLGGKAKQLAVSQTVPKYWVHWVVSLSRGARVLFYSRDFDLSRELMVADLDHDGVSEIFQCVMRFDYFDVLAHSESPLPTVIFKYNARVGKYLPANRRFAGYLLKGVDADLADARYLGQGLDRSRDYRKNYSAAWEAYLGKLLDVVLTYIYAGKEKRGWAIYDREYRFPDSRMLKRKIKHQLASCPVYKFLYRR